MYILAADSLCLNDSFAEMRGYQESRIYPRCYGTLSFPQRNPSQMVANSILALRLHVLTEESSNRA